MENEECDLMSMQNIGADAGENGSMIVESMTRSLSEQVGESKVTERGYLIDTIMYLEKVNPAVISHKKEHIDDSVLCISKQKKGFVVLSLK